MQGESSNYDISQVAPQYRLVLAEFYNGIAVVFDSKEQFENAIRLWVFTREYFPSFDRYPVADSLTESVLKLRNFTDYSIYSKDTPPPKIRVVVPSEGSAINNDQPRIEFELKSGDIRGPRVDLSELQFTLDGQDLTEKMKIKSAIDTSAKPRVPFETLNIYYTPEQPLAPGTHTVYVKAVDTGGKVRQRTWTFQVI